MTKKVPCPKFMEQTEVNIFEDKYIVTDLSHEISPNIPTLPGHLKTVMWRLLSHEDCIESGLTKPPYSYQTTGIMICDHTSTHVDALNHVGLEPDAESIDRLPFEWFFTPGTWFDFSYKSPNAYITLSDIEEAIKKTRVKIKPQSTVLIYTGWYKKWNSQWEYTRNYPGLDRDATEFLNDLGAINIGADAFSTDSFYEVTQEKVQPMHMVCRERGIMNMENLNNIDKIPKHEFWFIALPLKFVGATGSPIRAVALVKKEASNNLI